jgi:hypothetical protein
MAGEPQEQSRSARERTLYDLLRGGGSPNPFPRPSIVPNFRQQPGLNSVATIGGQRYRQVDNGRANVLVPAGPLTPPAQLAQQRAAAERALFMAQNPLAGAAYGVASVAGASPRGRDLAMAFGATADAAMLGTAPFGARGRTSVLYPPRRPPLATSARDPIRTQPANATEQAMGANATVTRSMIGTGRRANRKVAPPGYLGSAVHDFGHLMSEGMGGTANTPQETMALHKWPNQQAMGSFEKAVIGRARRGEVVEYFVKPLYDGPASAPSSVVLSAQGSRGDFTPRIIPNIAGRPKK